MSAPDRLTYTVPEAAQQLGVSAALLRDLIASGDLPVLRLGRRVLVRRSTLERLAVECEDAEDQTARLRLTRSAGRSDDRRGGERRDA